MASRPSSTSVLQLHLPERWPDTSMAAEPVFRYARYEGARVDRGAARLREIPMAAQVIAVVPATRVLFVRAQLPGGRAGRQEKVLAFAVEDAVGASPEDVHAIYAGDTGDGRSLIAVVDRGWLKGAMGELDLQGFTPSRMLCEGELIGSMRGADAGTWTVVRLATGGFAHLGGCETIPLDLPAGVNEPPLALNLALDERTQIDQAPVNIAVYAGENVSVPDLSRWAQVLAVPVDAIGLWQPEAIDARGLTKTNLLAGLAGQKREGGDWLGRYKAAAIAAGVVLAGHVALTAVDWFRMSSEASNLRSGMEERFRKIFPDAKAVVDPALQMSRSLANLRRDAGELAPDDFVALLGRLAPALASLNATAKSVRYDKGALTLELAVPGNETQDSLGAKLRAPGVRVQVERIGPAEGGGSNASLKVSPA